MQLMRMLMIEDDADDRYLITRACEAYNMELVPAATLAEAQQKLTEGPFHACLVDLTLPDARNLTIINELRAALPDVPIYVLTGVDDPETKSAIMSAGVAGWFDKGARVDTIAQAVRITVALTALATQENLASVELDRVLALLQDVREAATRKDAEVATLLVEMRALAAALEQELGQRPATPTADLAPEPAPSS